MYTSLAFDFDISRFALEIFYFVSILLDCSYARLVSQPKEGGIEMHNRGSLGDFHAFKSTSGGSDNGGSSGGGSGCSTWFYVAIFILFALNELCKLF